MGRMRQLLLVPRLHLARRRGRRKLCNPSRRALVAPMLAAALGLGACLGPAPIDRATLLADRGRTGEAIQALEQHLKEHPQAVDERRLLIRLLGGTGRTDLAAEQAD